MRKRSCRSPCLHSVPGFPAHPSLPPCPSLPPLHNLAPRQIKTGMVGLQVRILLLQLPVAALPLPGARQTGRRAHHLLLIDQQHLKDNVKKIVVENRYPQILRNGHLHHHPGQIFRHVAVVVQSRAEIVPGKCVQLLDLIPKRLIPQIQDFHQGPAALPLACRRARSSKPAAFLASSRSSWRNQQKKAASLRSDSRYAS